MQISWDPKKDEEHKKKRGVGFQHVSKLLSSKYVIQTNSDYPDQIRVIGLLERKYWTLVVEHYEDDLGDLIWCSNFWESTKKEKEYAISEGIL